MRLWSAAESVWSAEEPLGRCDRLSITTPFSRSSVFQRVEVRLGTRWYLEHDRILDTLVHVLKSSAIRRDYFGVSCSTALYATAMITYDVDMYNCEVD